MQEMLLKFKEYLKSEGMSKESIRKAIGHVRALGKVSNPIFLTTNIIEELVNAKQCSESTRNQRIWSLRQYLCFVGRTDIPLPKEKHATKKVIRPLIPWDLEILYHTIKRFRDADNINTMVFLILDTGLKVEELMELRREYFQFEGDNVVLIFPYQGITRKFYLSNITKFYLADGCFQNVNTFNLSKRRIKKIFFKLRRLLKCKEVCPRRLRYQFIYNCMQKNMPIDAISHLLGHKNIKTTRKCVEAVSQGVNQMVDEGVEIGIQPEQSGE